MLNLMNGLKYKSFPCLIQSNRATGVKKLKQKRYLNKFNDRKKITKEKISQLSSVPKIYQTQIILKLSLHRHHPIHDSVSS